MPAYIQTDAAGIILLVQDSTNPLAELGANQYEIAEYDPTLPGKKLLSIDSAGVPVTEAVEVSVEAQPLTLLGFRQRFTLDEKVNIDLASIDNLSAPIEERRLAAKIRSYLTDLQSAQHIFLLDPQTQAGVQLLEAAGLLAEGRAQEILA